VKTISLTSGQVAIVDDEDFEWLNKFNWHVEKHKNSEYAARFDTARYVETGKNRKRYMHRDILGLTNSKIKSDHRNGNGLDNRRNNLRAATNAQNGWSFQTKKKSATSRFRGISWVPKWGKWQAMICVNRNQIFLGYFKCETEAAKAYDEAAIKYFGEFAAPNFPNQKNSTNP
jgi:hypothetical protein